MSPPTFRFSQSNLLSSTDVLGLWESASAGEEVSFSLPVSGEEDFTLWSVDLPADGRQAENLLNAQQLRLEQTGADLSQLPVRLAGFFKAGVQPASEASYVMLGESTPELLHTPELPAPELELSHWVLSAKGQWAASGQSSYGLEDTFRQGYDGAREQALAFLAQVQRSLANFAIVETRSGGQVAGRTEVSWLGSFATLWAGQESASLARQHEQSLALALATRSAWLRLGSLVIQAALKLSALASVNPLVALPAAYKYLTEILEQYRRLHP